MCFFVFRHASTLWGRPPVASGNVLQGGSSKESHWVLPGSLTHDRSQAGRKAYSILRRITWVIVMVGRFSLGKKTVKWEVWAGKAMRTSKDRMAASASCTAA